MKMKVILSMVAAFVSFGTSASAAPDPNFYIYLCFGQSNMESGGKRCGEKMLSLLGYKAGQPQ